VSSVATTFDTVIEDKPVGLWRDAFRRMRHNPSAIIGATIVGAMTFMAVFAPFLAPFDPLRGNLSESFLPPSAQHWMGTNIQGQDVLSRIIWGARLTLGIAVLSVTFGVIVGGFLGAIAGFFKGTIDAIIMRTVDIMLAIPGLLLAIGIVTFLGRGVVQIAMAIAIVNVPIFARLLRSSLLGLREADYVVAARADPDPSHAAKRDRSAHRAGNPGPGHGRRRRRGAGIPRARSGPAHAGVGGDAV
jgi:peptide/nickel transport system permease protein